MKPPKGCKKYEILLEVLKTDYDKLWLGLLALGGGIGTLLVRYPDKSILLGVAFLVTLAVVVALLKIRSKMLKVASILEKCEEEMK